MKQDIVDEIDEVDMFLRSQTPGGSSNDPVPEAEPETEILIDLSNNRAIMGGVKEPTREKRDRTRTEKGREYVKRTKQNKKANRKKRVLEAKQAKAKNLMEDTMNPFD